MIKAKLSNGAFIIGLSRKNLENLLKDKPIQVQLADVGLPAQQILIVGGETEQAIYEELKKHVEIDSETLIHGMPEDGTEPPKGAH